MTDPKQNPDLSKMAKDLQLALKTADEMIEKALPFAAVAQTAFAAVMDSVKKAAGDAFVPPRDEFHNASAKSDTSHFEEEVPYGTARGWSAWTEDVARDFSIVIGDDAALNILAMKSSSGISPVVRVDFADGVRHLLGKYGPVHLTIAARVVREAYNDLYTRRVESGLPKPRKNAKKVNTERVWYALVRDSKCDLGSWWTQDEENAWVDRRIRELIEQLANT